MRAMVASVAAALALVTVGGQAFGEWDFVVEALPASLLIDVSGSDFDVSEGGDTRELSSVYIMPTVAAGVGTDVDRFYFDLVGGAGLVVNDSLQSFLLMAEVSAMYSFTDAFIMGPHVGYIYFTDPDWRGSEDIDVDDTPAYLVGLKMAMGDRIMYLVAVDLIIAEFDIEAGDGVATEDDSIDMTGLSLQFGVRGEF